MKFAVKMSNWLVSYSESERWVDVARSCDLTGKAVVDWEKKTLTVKVSNTP